MNRIKDYKQLAEDISTWIKQYATDNNIKSLVVGVSGGIDSTVVSALCCATGLPVYLCIIPIDSNNDHTKTAQRHCDWLFSTYGDERHLLHMPLFDLTGAYRTMATMTNIKMTPPDDHVCANIKSRIRMLSLYAVATQCNGIVVGTGNKVEDFGIGFYTKYGDGGVDISPIADLYKTEVRELGRYLGVSQEIIDAAPTDGLFSDGRTDEQQIGATYEELEWAMDKVKLIDTDGSPTFVTNDRPTERQEEVMKIYTKLHQQNQHKMLPIPIYKLNL